MKITVKLFVGLIFALNCNYLLAGNESVLENDFMSVTQMGDKKCQLDFTWPDGHKVCFTYNNESHGGKGWIGWTGFTKLEDGLINGVTGGIAISGGDQTGGFLHSHLPKDLNSNALIEVYTDDVLVFKATDSTSDSWIGPLENIKKAVHGRKVRLIISGMFNIIEAPFKIEYLMDGGVPRMIYSRISLKHTMDLKVWKLYHQLLSANSTFMRGNLAMCTRVNGEIYTQSGVTERSLPIGKMSDGLFYVIDNQNYIGFLANHSDCEYFLLYQKEPNYFASYKTIYKDKTVKAGTVNTSSGITCWGYSISEMNNLLELTAMIRKHKNIEEVNMIALNKKQILFIKSLFAKM